MPYSPPNQAGLGASPLGTPKPGRRYNLRTGETESSENLTDRNPLEQGAYGNGSSYWTGAAFPQPGVNASAAPPGGPGSAPRPGGALPQPNPDRDSYLAMLKAKIGASGTPSPTLPPPIQRGAGGSFDQEQAARRASMGLARTQAFGQGQQALQNLYGNISRRGMGGGGYEVGQIGRSVVEDSQPLQQLLVQQTQSDLDNAEHVADLDYTGGISQRSTNIGAGQDSAIFQEQQRQNQIQAILEALRAIRY